MKRKQIILGAIILIVCGGVLVGFLNQGTEAEVLTIQEQQVVDTFTEDGVVNEGDAVEVIGKVSGTVTEVLVKENQYVEKGDVIAKIDAKDYKYQIKQHENTIQSYKAQIQETIHSEEQDKANMSYSIEQLKSQLVSLQAGKKATDIKQAAQSSPEEYINLLSLNLESCKNSYDLGLKNNEQLKALYEIGAVSEHEIEVSNNELINQKAALTKAKTQYEASQAQLEKLKEIGVSSDDLNKQFYALQDENLEANMESVELQIKAYESQINHDYSSDIVARINALIALEENTISELKDSVSDCAIVATASGYITQLPVVNLSEVQVGTSIATIRQDNKLQISCDVLTTCEPYLKVGDTVKLTQKLKSEDIVFSGTIEEIYDFAKESTSALGLKEYRVEIVIVPNESEVSLKDGYEVEVTFTTYQEDHVLAVPNSATFEIDGVDYVYKVEDHQTVLCPIEIAHQTNTESVVVKGIQKGDVVICHANEEGMTENIHIKPIKE